jgi:tryptophan 2,3-dioxygenase
MACPLRRTGAVSEDLKSESDVEVNYQDYLKVQQLLNLQQPRSAMLGKNGAVHDEHLFIVIHQVYELWFKQILHELDSVMEILSTKVLQENQMLIINSRVTRITVILKILVEQVKVLETMTPLDFLEFRHLLVPASGYQSLQFRLLEVKLGVPEANRVNYGSETFR